MYMYTQNGSIHILHNIYDVDQIYMYIYITLLLRPLLTLVSMDIEDLEEKLALAGEVTMQEDSKPTHKLLKADLAILHSTIDGNDN